MDTAVRRAARRVWPVVSKIQCDYCKNANALWRAGFERPVINICGECYYEVLLRILSKYGTEA